MVEKIEVFFGADAECSEVALDFENRQVFLGSDDDGPNQVGSVPHSMIAFLADKMTTDLFKELFEFLVMDRTKGGHT